MALSKEDVLKVARLARIELTQDQVETFRVQLSGVLDYIAQLNSVDTAGVHVTAQVTGLENVSRPDSVRDCPDDERQGALAQAPQRSGNLVRVTNVF
jgi:aspartyl-tRNA(Asn)/glutamyl-tRNA(Gln) amidotransferase subunit C